MWPILTIFLFWRILTLIYIIIAPLIFSIPQDSIKYLGLAIYPRLPYLGWVWANYDGVHYLTIAQSSYDQFNFAFFPFLPFLIHLAYRFFSIPHLIAGVLICNLAVLVSFLVIYKIILLDYDRKTALKTLLFLAIFPLSYYLGFIYSEGPFILLAISSFYFARKSNWIKAGILGYLASTTRFFGVALLPALIVEWFQQNSIFFKQGSRQINWSKIIKKFITTKAYFLFLIPLGVITYGIYLQIKYHDFLLFQKSLVNWGQDKFIIPLRTFWRYLKIITLFPQKTAFVYWVSVLEFTSLILYFALSVYVLFKIRFSYGIFMLVSLIIPTCTGTLQSMPRYLLPLFPGFLALALLTQKNKKLFWGIVICFLALGLILTACFSRGYFTG